MANLVQKLSAALAWRARSVSRRLRNFGSNRRCPICAANVRLFGAEGEEHAVLFDLDVIGGGRRDGVVCPVCDSVDRERLVYLFLNRRGLVNGPMRIMHVAPEVKLGPWLRKRAGRGYLSADLTVTFVDQNLDLTDIPYPEATFDAIICNHVMEHIPDDAKAMRECFRVMKPGGWGIFQVPIGGKLDMTVEDPSEEDPAERQRRFGQHDHLRIYARRDYVARLERAGFEVEQFRWTDDRANFGGAENKYGLLEKEVLFFVRKPAMNGAAA
jgi:hypothetical protein